MNNIGILLLFVVVVIVVTTVAAIAGYLWASSATKSTLLKHMKEQQDVALKQAQEQFQRWKEDELSSIREHLSEVISGEAAVSLAQWKSEVEKEIRQDAIGRSQSVTMGKMTEHVVPYLPGFCFNPTDARFIGSPIDLIVFDGLGDGDIKKIVFIEIKTGMSTLSTRERIVRNAIKAGKVEWMELNANLGGQDVVREVKTRKEKWPYGSM
jgi:predicted Holliday junction resolvase-like endonuclease